MKRHFIIYIALIAVSAAFTVVSLIVLPDTVVTQLSFSGSPSTMPKLLAVAIPTLLGIGGAVVGLTIESGKAKAKPLIVSAAGIVFFIIMLAVNLQHI